MGYDISVSATRTKRKQNGSTRPNVPALGMMEAYAADHPNTTKREAIDFLMERGVDRERARLAWVRYMFNLAKYDRT